MYQKARCPDEGAVEEVVWETWPSETHRIPIPAALSDGALHGAYLGLEPQADPRFLFRIDEFEPLRARVSPRATWIPALD
jgi:hypothetical protein